MASPPFRIPQAASAVQFPWPANSVDGSWLSPEWVGVRPHFRHDPVDHLDGDKRINAEIGNGFCRVDVLNDCGRLRRHLLHQRRTYQLGRVFPTFWLCATLTSVFAK
jgi:hypothetical protein